MRIGEICGIKKADVDLENSILHIRRTTQRLKTEENGKTKLVTNSPKSQKSYRDIPIPPFLSDILKSYGIQELSESQYILGKKDVPYEPRTLQYAFGRILRDCNIPAMKFHCLRHTFATKCIQSGFDVKTLSEILGHSNVNFTMNRYVHSDFERKKEQMKLLEQNWKNMMCIS